jgi:hypothetical protein
MKAVNRWIVAAVVTAAFAVALSVAARAASAVNLSGYEFLLGSPCLIEGFPGTCGVAFGGWTGGSGANPGGFAIFPGNRRGLWEASINYTGSPAFGAEVHVAGGSYDVLFKNAKTVSGAVITGTVMWPADASDDDAIGCGAGVARIDLTLSGDASSFSGCLLDLPAGSVIPPKIWGTLQ